jgi:hypothetical protein
VIFFLPKATGASGAGGVGVLHFLQDHLLPAQHGRASSGVAQGAPADRHTLEKLASSFLAMVKLSFVRRYFRMLERFSGST